MKPKWYSDRMKEGMTFSEDEIVRRNQESGRKVHKKYQSEIKDLIFF